MTYTPEWTGAVEGYVKNFLAKNLWRLRGTHEHEDAVNSAYVMFLVCASKYPALDTPQHFMALFKTAWTNEFNDLSVKAGNVRKAISMTDLNRVDEDGEEITTPIESVGEMDNAGALALMVKQAPKEVLMVLNLFLNAPQELLELATKAWTESGKYQAGGERWVEKMLGMKAGTCPIKKTEEYFTTK